MLDKKSQSPGTAYKFVGDEPKKLSAQFAKRNLTNVFGKSPSKLKVNSSAVTDNAGCCQSLMKRRSLNQYSAHSQRSADLRKYKT